jgi:DNA-binding PadR family transcriptional regulator
MYTHALEIGGPQGRRTTGGRGPGRWQEGGRGFGRRKEGGRRAAALRAMTARGRGPWGPGQGRGHGSGPWGGPPFGGPGFGRRRRRRRGDVRAALLVLLAEEPRNGYGLMQEVEHRSEGAWRPSPGSVYPALAQLEDEGLVRAEEVDGAKRFVLTDDGRAYVDEHRERLGEPWADLGGENTGRHALRHALGQLAAAAWQVGGTGDDAQVEQARKVLDDARKAIYRLLAEDDAADADADAPREV